MENMDEYMSCLEQIALTNHIEDADPETCIKLPEVNDPEIEEEKAPEEEKVELEEDSKRPSLINTKIEEEQKLDDDDSESNCNDVSPMFAQKNTTI